MVHIIFRFVLMVLMYWVEGYIQKGSYGIFNNC